MIQRNSDLMFCQSLSATVFANVDMAGRRRRSAMRISFQKQTPLSGTRGLHDTLASSICASPQVQIGNTTRKNEPEGRSLKF